MAKRDEVGSRIFDYEGYRPAGKDFSPPAELDDLTEILETGVERIKKNNGRPCTYPCTREGLQKLAEACAGYIERFYPFRACSAETEARVEEALKEARERQGELSDVEIQEIRERLEAIDYTPDADRERLFTCFLRGWNFQNFRLWDWTGNRITAEEADRLRAYYTDRQKQYQDHPERFSPPALKADDDMSRYSPEVQQLLTTFDNLSD